MLSIKLIAFVAILPSLLAFPTVDDTKDMVVVTQPSTSQPAADDKEGNVNDVPKITEMNIKTNITNRFAQTVCTSRVKNFAAKAKETTFFVIIPDQAFISGFVMEIDGKNYTAYVQEKNEAKQTYDDAINRGVGAAHIAVSARDSNKFIVTLNIEAQGKASFYLTYEELLERKEGAYELVISIHPKQLVKSLNVEVDITENRPIKYVKTPPLRSGNEITKEAGDQLHPRAVIQTPTPNSRIVKFDPDYEQQKQIAAGLGTDQKEGISGQFVVQYDVERDPQGGEVLVKDGYFVHFFAPSNLEPLVKHVVFVLDTSGSMYGRKIEQLKSAMQNILKDLNPQDYFNLVEFNSNVKVWNLDAPAESTYFPDNEDSWYSDSSKVFDLSKTSFPPAYPVNNNTVKKANDAVKNMDATGGTNIYEAIRVGIHLVKLRQKRTGNKSAQPLIIFLTDGDATVGKVSTNDIIAGISEENLIKIPIISLSFGDGADREILKKISLGNYGFARHIYEDSDATLQLENFYKEISSPLLSDVKFTYTPDTTSLTKTVFPILFRGGEIAVAGKIDKDFKDVPYVECIGANGLLKLVTTVSKSVGQLERLWAYMTVKKYLSEKEIVDDKTLNKELETKAKDLALKYSFVTPLTSLVVVKPNSTAAVNAEAADSNPAFDNSYVNRFAAGPVGLPGLPSPMQFPVMRSSLMPRRKLTLSKRKFSGFTASAVSFGAGLHTTQVASSFLPETYEESFSNMQSLDEVVSSTVATTTTTAKPFVLPDEIKNQIGWLEGKLRPDGSLSFYKGNYNLGLNATSPVDSECTDPQSQQGLCKLIKDCPVLLPKLIDEITFKEHFCVIDSKYAGICCPKGQA